MTDPAASASDADPAVVVRKERFKPPLALRTPASRAPAAQASAPARPVALARAFPGVDPPRGAPGPRPVTGTPHRTAPPPRSGPGRGKPRGAAPEMRLRPPRAERRQEPEERPESGKRPHEGRQHGHGSGERGPDPEGRRQEQDGHAPRETALSLDATLFHAALGAVETAPPVPLSSLTELVARVEVMMRQTQLPSLALTLSGALAGRIELLKSGPGCVRIHLDSRERWSARNRQALEAELQGRGIRVTAWTQGPGP